MTDDGWTLSDAVPQHGQAALNFVADLHDRYCWTQRVGRDGDGDAVGIQLACDEGVVLAIATLPIAAMDVNDQRRFLVSRGEEVITVPLARAIRLVERGSACQAVGHCQHFATLDPDEVLRMVPLVVVVDLKLDGVECHSHHTWPKDFLRQRSAYL